MNAINNTYNLYLDDTRLPSESVKRTANTLYETEKWTIVRNYRSFVELINTLGVPVNVSFDHDLCKEHMDFYFNTNGADPTVVKFNEKTGFDCMIFLIGFIEDNNLKIPRVYVHSHNPQGSSVMMNTFERYMNAKNNGTGQQFADDIRERRKQLMGK